MLTSIMLLFYHVRPHFTLFKGILLQKKVQGNQGVREFTRARAKWRLGENSAALPCKFAICAVYYCWATYL